MVLSFVVIVGSKPAGKTHLHLAPSGRPAASFAAAVNLPETDADHGQPTAKIADRYSDNTNRRLENDAWQPMEPRSGLAVNAPKISCTLRSNGGADEVVSQGAVVRGAGPARVSQRHAASRRRWVIEWLALVNAMHITASVFINDDERGLHHDYEVWLE